MKVRNLIVVLLSLLIFFGCGKKDEDVIKIGAILPLKGDNAVYGIEIRRGIEIGVKEINNKNGINGKELRVLFEDDQADPQKSVTAYRKLTTLDKVPLILGGVFSSSTLAIAPLANRNSVILLSPTSSAIEITEAGEFVFRIYPSDSYDGIFLSEYSYYDINARTAAILFLQVTSTTAIANLYKDIFEKLGGRVLLMEGHSEGETDFRSSLNKVKSLNPDVIFMPSYLREMSIILRQAKSIFKLHT